jgi:hypothetical protein
LKRERERERKKKKNKQTNKQTNRKSFNYKLGKLVTWLVFPQMMISGASNFISPTWKMGTWGA